MARNYFVLMFVKPRKLRPCAFVQGQGLRKRSLALCFLYVINKKHSGS